jgi:uncharacterized membrane protein YbaN (DUF454 family)
MKAINASTRAMPLVYKVAMIGIIAVCLVLGVIGLILPIIPGLLFLGLAVMLAGKLSKRVARWARGIPVFNTWSNRRHAVAGLSALQRLKLAFWVSARYTLNSVNSLATRLNSTGTKT